LPLKHVKIGGIFLVGNKLRFYIYLQLRYEISKVKNLSIFDFRTVSRVKSDKFWPRDFWIFFVIKYSLWMDRTLGVELEWQNIFTIGFKSYSDFTVKPALPPYQILSFSATRRKRGPSRCGNASKNL